jgi:prepilin-type N-terminal cleavage/methylation domain-containing protein
MKYAVVITSDFTAKLFTGRVGSQGSMIAATPLNSDLPLTHGDQRLIIDEMMENNKVTPMTFEHARVDANTTILYGEFINFHTVERKIVRKQELKAARRMKAKVNSEAGFSLLELVVACAIILILTSMAFPHYMALQENIKAQAEIAEQQQVELENYLNGLGY